MFPLPRPTVRPARARAARRPSLAALGIGLWLGACGAALFASPTAWASPGAAPPSSGEPGPLARPAPRSKPVVHEKLIDLNRASLQELQTLPGVGEAEARRIMQGRPYLTKAELVTKDVIPTGPYLVLKDQVVAMPLQPVKPSAKR